MININQDYQTIEVSYFNTEGEVEIEKIRISQEDLYEWVPTQKGSGHSIIKAWDGRDVKKQKANFLSKWRVQQIFQELPKTTKDKIFQMNTPKKFFLDIEVLTDGEFPQPALALYEVSLISFTYNDILAILGTKPLSQQEIKKIENDTNSYLASKNYPPKKLSYLYFKSEYDLLFAFFNKYIQKMPLISGWNFIGFDWPYLVNRCKKLGIDPGAASYTGELIGKAQLPVHRLLVDYIELYKKWDTTIFKENNTLNYVATAATGLGKIPYTGTLYDLYHSDFSKYVFYGGIDSILVQLIDNQISTLSTFLKLGSITNTELYKVFSPIAITENVMCREFFKRNLVIPREDRKIIKGNYEGAFVFPPKKDIYEWVASFDFASLYPSIMRQWNMSPESFVKKEKEKNEDMNFTQASNGALFKKSEDSVFRTILTDFYNQRKVAKNKGKEIEAEINELKKMLF